MQKTVSHIPVFQKMEARKKKKKTQEKSAPNLRETPAPRGLGKGAGAKGLRVFLKPSKISLHSNPPQWGPLGPAPAPFSGPRSKRERESERASAAEIPEPRPSFALIRIKITDLRITVTDFNFLFRIN